MDNPHYEKKNSATHFKTQTQTRCLPAATDARILYSPTKSKNHGKISDSECRSCWEWKSEIKTLKSEVKSESEIIKILTCSMQTRKTTS